MTSIRRVLVSVGVSEALDLALRAILNSGDEVIFHEPSYVSYSPSITLAGGRAGLPFKPKRNTIFDYYPDAIGSKDNAANKGIALKLSD